MRRVDLYRQLHSSGRECPFECAYCFAKGEAYQSSAASKFQELQHDKIRVVYPSCDSELALDIPLLDSLSRKVEKSISPTIISFSTKAAISTKVLQRFRQIDNELRSRSMGFVKASVSFSTKHSIWTLEPGTASYESRMETLKSFRDAGLLCSVNIKPILPNIEYLEYEEIVHDTVGLSEFYLLGGLYLDPSLDYGKKIIADYGPAIRLRRVDWLEEQPYWPYLADEKKIEAIRKYCSAVGAMSFNRDVEFLTFAMARFVSVEETSPQAAVN